MTPSRARRADGGHVAGQRGGGAAAGAVGESLPGAGPDSGSREGSVGAARCPGGRVRARGVGKVLPVEAWQLSGSLPEREVKGRSESWEKSGKALKTTSLCLEIGGFFRESRRIKGIGTAVIVLFSVLSVNCVTCWEEPCWGEN